MRSKCEGSRGTCPAAPAGLYHPQRLLGSHPSPISLGSSKEKAFSKGVVFEKEGNHLSLCIIACSRNISLPSSNCSQCADPGSSLRWGLLGLQPSGSRLPGADRSCRQTRLFSPALSPSRASLPPSSVLQTSSLPVFSPAEQSRPLNSGRAGNQPDQSSSL